MQTSKSSQNTNRYNRIAFGIACILHMPFVLFALGLEILPQKPQEPAKEIGAMSFALASFASAMPMQEPEPEPQPKVIPKHYEAPKKKPKERKHVQNREKHEHKQKVPREEVQQKAANAADTTQYASTQNQQPINLGSNHKNPFLAEIKRLIDAHNAYPRMARRMRLSGEVTVRMVLDDNGKIVELRVIESSTHAILDEQAIRTIQEASQLFPKPDKAYTLHIPIAYQLNLG